MLKIAIACASGAALLFLGTLGFAGEASPLHQGDWPIHNGHDQQPTQDQLNALDLHDVTPNQAQEVDQLYDKLMSNGERGNHRQSTDSEADDDINKENQLLDRELQGICRGC
jgi:Spy/CpxP family protein refolding chaperone